MKNMKKLLALFLALALCASLLAGCSGNGSGDSQATESAATESAATESAATESAAAETSTEETSATESAATEESTEGAEIVAENVEAAVEYPAFNVGEVEANLGSSEGGEVNHTAFAGEAGKDYTDEAVYTLNDVMTATTSLNWNPLSWETSDDSMMMSYLTMGFYEFVLNENKDGWAIIPEMAADYPVDVTADYVGQFGVAEGETGKAWKIALNPDAVWEDGTPINADSYIYSYQNLLDPAQLNRRADSLYAGEAAIVGAKAYFYQGQEAFSPLGMTTSEYLANGSEEDLYLDPIGFWNAAGYVDAEGNEVPAYLPISDETIYSQDGTDAEDKDPFSAKSLYEEYFAPGMSYEDYAADYLGTVEGYPADASFDSVGILKTGDYELTFIFQAPISDPDYYVPYYLPMYLVKEDMYEALKVEQDGRISTTYGTSKDTTASYGPYKLDYFELDKQITFVRNDNWCGYKDGKHTGQYQADNVSIQVIDKHETQLLAFLNGEIDFVSLQQEDMEKYASSEYIRYEPQSYTTKLTFNTDESVLAERGTQVLGNLNFRKAFSLAIDRSTFAASYTAAGSAGYGMLNYMYVYDPFTGASYRNNDAAKAALCDLYGLTYGPDGDFDDVDEAYDAITGYDIEQAQQLMAIAYAQVTSDGTWDGTTPIKITLSVYQSDDIYVKMFNYLNDALKAACAGTGFEGKVELTMKADADYYETMYAGQTDMIFSTWGGSAYSPFTLLYECYCDAGINSDPNQMEYGFDSNAVEVTMTINGKEFTQSLQKWALWMDGDENTVLTSNDGSLTLEAFGNYDADTKCAIFAKVEYVYLANYVNTPIYYRNVGSLVSQKGDYAVDEYVDMVTFGGIRYYTFNYNDEEWAAAAGSLTY
ncbi:MAG: hypothetical protein J6P72_10625 [Firmicutes bacterium]|nr:hypothetical protein [Bacillota bacterium]